MRIIPYGHQWVDESDIKEVTKVLKSDWLTQGPKIKEFEDALCKYTGACAICKNSILNLFLERKEFLKSGILHEKFRINDKYNDTFLYSIKNTKLKEKI